MLQEQHVTVAGTRHDLPKPFHVLATQNPLEQEGTYPLPEAQLDRFLMEIDVGYPDRDAERRILFETTGSEETRAKAAMSSEDLIAAQRLVRRLPVGESVVEAILRLVRSARPGPESGEAAKLIETERSVATQKAAEDAEKAKAEGKTPQSPEIVTKRIEGSVAKFLKEVSLFNQAFVKNDKQTVEQMLKERATKVKGFTLYVVGEGIEKKVDDFAAEVAAQVAAAKNG